MNNLEKIDFLNIHLTYEINSLKACFNPQVIFADNETQHFISQFKLECFLIHARCLIDFFYGPRQHDDVLAIDFVPSWNPNTIPIFTTVKTETNKRVAHLTEYRLRNPPFNWSIQLLLNVYNEIKQATLNFEMNLPQNLKMNITLPKL